LAWKHCDQRASIEYNYQLFFLISVWQPDRQKCIADVWFKCYMGEAEGIE